MILRIFTIIKNLIYKFINFIFGKTKIFITILGWFLVITGVFMLLKPERARNKLIGMGFGQIKGVILIIDIYLVSLLISLSSKIGPIMVLAGIIAIIFSYFLLRNKVLSKIKEKFAKIPVKILKVFAGIQISIGVLMFVFLVRIW